MTKTRCPWLNLKNPLYVEYHDREWGRPIHDDRLHFEMLTLEGAQAGLSWETVLNKRQRYREVFSDFVPQKVAKFSSKKIERLLEDSGIIRNRLKIESSITNAKAFSQIQKEFGSFDDFIWDFVARRPIYNSFKKLSDYPTTTATSDTISQELKKRGFRFVGSTIIYAYMQAVGLTQDHSVACFLNRKKIRPLKSTS
jgi:DNA-3-methyladenine glycosylase I